MTFHLTAVPFNATTLRVLMDYRLGIDALVVVLTQLKLKCAFLLGLAVLGGPGSPYMAVISVIGLCSLDVGLLVTGIVQLTPG